MYKPTRHALPLYDIETILCGVVITKASQTA